MGRGFFVRHWKAGLSCAAGLAVLAVAAIAGWGIQAGRLPGNSMWVRWQYWQGSSGMIRDHAWTGVGAGNFGTYYPRYMDAAAPEVVTDPHSWPMALWSEWGVLGLLGFLLAIGWVSVLLARPSREASRGQGVCGRKGSWKHAVVYGVLAAVGILVVRFLNSSGLIELGEKEKQSVYLMSFLVPAAVWMVAYFLSWGGSESAGRGQGAGVLVLGCGLGGFLVHNSIDMAAFHPGVGSLFLATAALAVASRQGADSSETLTVGRGKWTRRGLCAATAVAVMMLWLCVVGPYCGAHVQMQKAQRSALTAYNLVESFEKGRVASFSAAQWDALQQEALEAARRASDLAKWDPKSLEFEGRLLFFLYQGTGGIEGRRLEEAIARMNEARGRDRENDRYHSQLRELYGVAVRHFPQWKTKYEALALEHAERAYALNPANGEVAVAYARLLKAHGQAERARAVFNKALEDERRFLQQQREMFGNQRRLTGRLPKEMMEELNAELGLRDAE